MCEDEDECGFLMSLEVVYYHTYKHMYDVKE